MIEPGVIPTLRADVHPSPPSFSRGCVESKVHMLQNTMIVATVVDEPKALTCRTGAHDGNTRFLCPKHRLDGVLFVFLALKPLPRILQSDLLRNSQATSTLGALSRGQFEMILQDAGYKLS